VLSRATLHLKVDELKVELISAVYPPTLKSHRLRSILVGRQKPLLVAIDQPLAMVDPLTIIGTTGAVIGIAKLAWEVVDTAYKFYTSEPGALEGDDTMEKIAKEMNSSLDKLSHQTTSSGGLEALVSRCKKVGEEIITLLDTTKAGEERSVRKSINTSFRKIWTKEKLEKLRKELDHIMTQLSIHLQILTR
jgi:hypothetical protein